MPEIKEVTVEPIYYYRLFKVINGNIEIGSNFYVGRTTFKETLQYLLNHIRDINGDYNHFEIYGATPTPNILLHNKIDKI